MLKAICRYFGLFCCLVFAAAVAAQEKIDYDYKLGPGDTIRIVVFQNPQSS